MLHRNQVWGGISPRGAVFSRGWFHSRGGKLGEASCEFFPPFFHKYLLGTPSLPGCGLDTGVLEGNKGGMVPAMSCLLGEQIMGSPTGLETQGRLPGGSGISEET